MRGLFDSKTCSEAESESSLQSARTARGMLVSSDHDAPAAAHCVKKLFRSTTDTVGLSVPQARLCRPGTEDSVTSDSDLQQSLSRCWALLPAVSSLTVMPQLTCPTTDRHSFQVKPEIPGPLTSSGPANQSPWRPGSSDNPTSSSSSVL